MKYETLSIYNRGWNTKHLLFVFVQYLDVPYLYFPGNVKEVKLPCQQISSKRGPELTSPLRQMLNHCLKSSRFRLVKMMVWGRAIRPRVEYRVENRVEYRILGEFLSKKVQFLLKSG